MKTENFTKLIQGLTGRDFNVYTTHDELISGITYQIYRILPISKYKVAFDFKVPKNEENIIKSFINTFSKKYFEPDTAKYDKIYGGVQYYWNDKTDEQKEAAYYHHRTNMLSPEKLKEQVKQNLSNPQIEDILWKYGFYHTNYGIGIFVLYSTEYELNAIMKMKRYLESKNIPFRNEMSEANWVYRFVINIEKESHKELLREFNNYYENKKEGVLR